jgi:hypothetical protein
VIEAPPPPIDQFAPLVPPAPPVPSKRTGLGSRLLTVFLAIAVLAAIGGLAFLYNDDRNLQNANRTLTSSNESLQGQLLGIQGQLTSTQGTLTKAQSDLAAAKAELAHPHLGIWNVSQTLMGPTYYLGAGIPDTFTYHLRLKSTGRMNVSILSLDEFTAAIRCIDNGTGVTDYCMHNSGTTKRFLGVTSVNFDFHLAEGCAGYLVIITAPSRVTVTPDVSVTYNPAPHTTGTCRS